MIYTFIKYYSKFQFYTFWYQSSVKMNNNLNNNNNLKTHVVSVKTRQHRNQILDNYSTKHRNRNVISLNME